MCELLTAGLLLVGTGIAAVEHTVGLATFVRYTLGPSAFEGAPVALPGDRGSSGVGSAVTAASVVAASSAAVLVAGLRLLG